MGALMLLALLLACNADKPAPADPETDAAQDTATNDTAAPDAWVPPEPACVLTRPLLLTGVPRIMDLYGPHLMHFEVFEYEFPDHEREFGCPTRVEEGADTHRWTGECELEAFAWSGEWTETEAGPDSGYTWRHDVEDVTLRYDELGAHLSIDGSAWYEETADGEHTLARSFRWSAEGYAATEANEGEWQVESVEHTVPGTVHTSELYADARTVLGLDGDYCILEEATPWPGCDQEPYGGWLVQGANRVVVTFDPHVACDGCGAATLDGVAVGEVCGSEYGTWVP